MKDISSYLSGVHSNMRKKIFKIFLTSFLLSALIQSTILAGTIYVDSRAAGDNNGSSWTNAYNCLQDALADADSAEKPVDILIAQGLYMPDKGNNRASLDQEATFQMISGVTLKGGFAGLIKQNPDERDIHLYKTILSGDLADNDVTVTNPLDLPDESSRTENSFHVVTSNLVDETAVLDGLIITGGIRNGMYNKRASPTIINCTFSDNSAERWGGGMSNENGNPRLSHCMFVHNSAQYGGGIWNFRSSPVLSCCTFNKNSAIYGGAMYNYNNSHPQIACCIFTGNSAIHGGGIYCNNNCRPAVTNCTMTRNSAKNSGGAIRNHHYSCPILTNCILWENSPNEIVNYYMSKSIVNYCFVQNGADEPWFGKGCIEGNPLFLSTDNLLLSPNSPCIDAGDNTAVASKINTSINGRPRILNGTVDMGAFEVESIKVTAK